MCEKYYKGKTKFCLTALKCQEEQNGKELIHTINFQSLKTHKLEAELSEYKYLQESLFAFPPAKKDPDCTLLKNVIESNIKSVEEDAMGTLSTPTIKSVEENAIKTLSTPIPIQTTTPTAKTQQLRRRGSSLLERGSTPNKKN
jgi:hypothetical protein